MNYNSRIETDATVAGYDGANPFAEVSADERRSRRRLILIGLIVALLMAVTWWLLHRSAGAEGADGKKQDQAPVVSVITPGRTTIEGTISANGTLAARRELPVGSVGEGGQVISVLVEPGQWVRQGQILAVVDRSVQSQQQASQAAQIQVAQADARLAQANLDRALRLVDKGFISKADVDRLTATRDAANARIRVASATLGQLRAQAARLKHRCPGSRTDPRTQG